MSWLGIKGLLMVVTYGLSVFLYGFLSGRGVGSGLSSGGGGLGLSGRGSLDLVEKGNFRKGEEGRAWWTHGSSSSGLLDLGGLNLGGGGRGSLDGRDLLNGDNGGSGGFGGRHYCRTRRELDARGGELRGREI
jgi:hypothetical protein